MITYLLCGKKLAENYQLKKDKSFCIHHRNIQSLAIELFKVKNNLSNRIMCDIFETRNLDYNLRSQIDFIRTRVNTSSFGLSSLKYLATKIWDSVPYEIKSVGNLSLFKKKIRNWKPKDVIAGYANNIFMV